MVTGWVHYFLSSLRVTFSIGWKATNTESEGHRATGIVERKQLRNPRPPSARASREAESRPLEEERVNWGVAGGCRYVGVQLYGDISATVWLVDVQERESLVEKP